MKPMLANPDKFLDQVKKCKADKISGSKLSGLKKRLAKIDPEQANKSSKACYGLVIWLQQLCKDAEACQPKQQDQPD